MFTLRKRYIGAAVLALAIFMLNQGLESAAVPWWNTKYKYREQITISTEISAVSTGYVVKLTIDTDELCSTGKLQGVVNNEMKDLRIVYWSGNINAELNRDFIVGDSKHPGEIWFKLQSAIASGNSDSNYYLYYGNPAETATPPNELSEIYDIECEIFSRATSATYIDSNGVIQEVNNNEPRFVNGKYNKGIFLENGGEGNNLTVILTNNLIQSSFESDSAGAAPTGWTTSGNPTVSADYKIHKTKSLRIATADSQAYARQSVFYLKSGIYTASCWVYIAKYTSGEVEIGLQDVTNSAWFYQKADTTKIGQWQRISVKNTTAATSLVVSLEAGRANGTAEVYYDAVQLEAGNDATSYIYTETSTAGRAGDYLAYLAKNNINTSAGTINLWVNTTATSLGILQVNYHPAHVPNAFRMLCADWTKGAYVEWRGTGEKTAFVSRKIINDGAWHMITLTWDRSAVTIYIDAGDNTASTTGHTLASAYDSNDNHFRVGACSDYGTISGSVSDVSVFDYVLCSAEVKNLYTRTTPPRMSQNAKFFINFANNITAYKRTTVVPEPILSLKAEELYSTISTK